MSQKGMKEVWLLIFREWVLCLTSWTLPRLLEPKSNSLMSDWNPLFRLVLYSRFGLKLFATASRLACLKPSPDRPWPRILYCSTKESEAVTPNRLSNSCLVRPPEPWSSCEKTEWMEWGERTKFVVVFDSICCRSLFVNCCCPDCKETMLCCCGSVSPIWGRPWELQQKKISRRFLIICPARCSLSLNDYG